MSSQTRMASSRSILFSMLALVNFLCISLAFDASPLLDFCVADPTGKAACKDPKTVTADDFFFTGLNLPGNTSNPYGAAVTVVSSATMPGLNGLGLTLMRADLAPNGFFPPHFHTRATELVAVLEGSMEVGFITSYPEYKYFSKILNSGDAFAVPVGLVHTVRNLAAGNSVAMVAFNSQNPGVVNIPNAVFAAEPAVDAGYLAAAFRLSREVVEEMERKF